MKRCHRFLCNQNEPYIEFNFEKSLRKYEKIPHKRVKTDALISRQEVLSVINNNEKIEQFISQNNEQCSQNPSQIVQEATNQFQSVLNAVYPIEQNGLVGKDIIKEGKVQQKGRQDLVSPINDDQSQLISQTFLIENPQILRELEIFQNQKYSEHIDNANLESLPDLEEKMIIGQQQGGRIYISSNVSVSKRSIERLLKQKKTDSKIVDQLCKSRSYLQTMRSEIQERLKLYRQGK